MASSLKEAMEKAADREFERIMSKGSEEFGKSMEGGVRIYGGEDDPVTQAWNAETKKKRLREVN